MRNIVNHSRYKQITAVAEMIYFYNISKKLRLYYKTEMSLATRVSPKKILH